MRRPPLRRPFFLPVFVTIAYLCCQKKNNAHVHLCTLRLFFSFRLDLLGSKNRVYARCPLKKSSLYCLYLKINQKMLPYCEVVTSLFFIKDNAVCHSEASAEESHYNCRIKGCGSLKHSESKNFSAVYYQIRQFVHCAFNIR